MESVHSTPPEVGHEGSGISLLEKLLARRSVHPKRLVEPGPGCNEIRQIICAAATATDHCGLQPWRFIAITGEAREHLAEVFVQTKLAREPESTLTELARERDRARSVPVLVAVIARLYPDHKLVPLSEQYASVGAAIQNMLICANALGFGAKMVSGRKCRDMKLFSAFELDDNESLFGFLCMGTAVPGTRFKPRPTPEKILSIWKPQALADAHSGNCRIIANAQREPI